MTDSGSAQSVAAARRIVASLHQEADELRANLIELRRDTETAQRGFSAPHAAELREANEQLVLAALNAETIAETAISDMDELARTSQRDLLTGLPNRILMLDRLEHAIDTALRHGTRLAVLFIDLDHFKPVNDTLGHAAGDEVLQIVAHRLEATVRGSDSVSRHGGDEFLVLLGDIAHTSDAARIAAKMLTALAANSPVDGHAVMLSASIGIAVYPQDGTDAEALISCADAAMYSAKESGGNTFALCSEMNTAECDAASTVIAKHDTQPASANEFVSPRQQLRLQQLREANEQLVISALSAQETGDVTKEAHREQIQFLAMVAHELRNPLAPLRSATDLLLRARANEPMYTRLQAIIERQVTHLTRLVDDLLDGSRVSIGKFRLALGSVELVSMLAAVATTCRPAMDAKQQRLTVQLPPAPLVLWGDAMRLAQIFSNLLDNAGKYSPGGSTITLTLEAQETSAVITVTDDGSGIEADILPSIFDLFVQDSRMLAVGNGGLGIGLAVVRDLVEAHGGTVVASSAGKNLGSTFVVILPLIGPDNSPINDDPMLS